MSEMIHELESDGETYTVCNVASHTWIVRWTSHKPAWVETLIHLDSITHPVAVMHAAITRGSWE